MKSSWTSCAGPEHRLRRRLAVGLVGLVLALLVTSPAVAAKKLKNFDRELLIQPFLGPGHAEWLIGPIARIADKDEAEAYLRLDTDAAAAAFVDEFWRKRDPDPDVPGNALRDLFEERAAEADKLYSEGQVRGRNTDRGTLHVLYGPPAEIDYDIAQWPGGPPLILWKYPKGADKGLDGERPAKLYRLIRLGDLTVFYEDRMRQQALRKQPFRPDFRNDNGF